MASAASRNAGRTPLELTVDQQVLRDVARALKDESDGKLLRRELARALRKTADEPIAKAKAEILKAPSHKLKATEPLRATVAGSVKPIVRLSGTRTGVSIRQTQTPGLRNFKLAGRKFNKHSFRHPVYGNTEKWVAQQTYANGWFDRPMRDAAPEFKDDVIKVVQDLVDTLAARARAAARP